MIHLLQVLTIAVVHLLGFLSAERAFNPFKALVAPITKDERTSLYTATFSFNQSYVIDLDAPLSWFFCSYHHPHVTCTTPACLAARTFLSPKCGEPGTATLSKYHCRNCITTRVNPVTRSCSVSELSYTTLIIYWTYGEVMASNYITFAQIYMSCAPSSLFKSLPRGVRGLVALSSAPHGLSTQIAQSFVGVSNKFAVCLPRKLNSHGTLFFGDGPYYFRKNSGKEVELSSILSYTPLLSSPKLPEHFISLSAISIDGNDSSIPVSAFALIPSAGQGGVKLSTSVTYTKLRSDIHDVFVGDFKKAAEARGIERAGKEGKFKLCFNKSSISQGRAGFNVPRIDLKFGNGEVWSIDGANSMKQVSNHKVCLGFTDGGMQTGQAIVIGSHQIEDNFLVLDLVRSRLGFSTSLLNFGTTCSSFRFK